MMSFILLLLLGTPNQNTSVIKIKQPIITNQTIKQNNNKAPFAGLEEEPVDFNLNYYKKRKKRRL